MVTGLQKSYSQCDEAVTGFCTQAELLALTTEFRRMSKEKRQGWRPAFLVYVG